MESERAYYIVAVDVRSTHMYTRWGVFCNYIIRYLTANVILEDIDNFIYAVRHCLVVVRHILVEQMLIFQPTSDQARPLASES